MRRTVLPDNRFARNERGVTLIELLVALSLLGIMAAVAVGPWTGYRLTAAHRGTTDKAVSTLRNAQVAAVAERIVYRVDVMPTRLIVFRTSGAIATEVRRVDVEEPAIKLVAPTFTKPDGTATTSVWFYPRGSASGGSLKVTREGRDKEYVVTVEALTGRVSHD